jgi:hypothetical protein
MNWHGDFFPQSAMPRAAPWMMKMANTSAN